MKNENLRLAGKEVYLRYPNENDFDELTELFCESKKHFKGLVQPPLDKRGFHSLLAGNLSDTTEMFLICKKCDDVIAGTITLSQIFRKSFQNAYLGYLLGAKYTGNGYMTDAVNVILKFGFKNLKLHRVEANVQPNNEASLAVLRRNGFVKEGFSKRYLKIGGRWRDHERWAIISDIWKSK